MQGVVPSFVLSLFSMYKDQDMDLPGLLPGDVPTEYGTAECCCGQRARIVVEEEPEEVEAEKSIEVESSIKVEELESVRIEPAEPADEVESVISPPSEVPMISDEVNPEEILLPSSRSPASTLSSLSGGWDT
ncbi:hypothetical protein BDM02DRAFT_3192309 [Thelephora ganbajun]|uniref:Uncharacterized protein n=1 Tax=Thelephora ganbajun TaxID=370292 RepID=A0ACB6Z0U7_THEGA|nr:hypothetical protein BDM02DRAFT_3192309 [Thelephora ganbajun]